MPSIGILTSEKRLEIFWGENFEYLRKVCEE
jgi:hypothetical protein